MSHTKNIAVFSVTITGLLFLLAGMFLSLFGGEQKLTGTAVVSPVSDQSEIQYDAKVKNTLSAPIRLCGGQLDWCVTSGCYKVLTPFPLTLEPGQEATITVSISPREEELSETELILYADGKGLDGLTPVKIKLPAMSWKSR